MGGITTTPPGGESGTGVVAPDLTQQAAQEELGRQQAAGSFLARQLYAVVRAVPDALMTGILFLWDGLMILLVSLAAKASSDKTNLFYSLATTVLGELLGQDLPSPSTPRPGKWSTDYTRQLGQNLLNLLGTELGSEADASIANQAGALPAATFLGFLMAFGVRESTATAFADLLPFDMLKEFREMGLNVATNLGLGRLARRALGPFIDDLCGKPLQDLVRRTHRPTDLNVAEAVRGFNRGIITQQQFSDAMSKLGYADDLTDALVAEYLGHLAPAEIDALERYGDLTHDKAIAEYQGLGYTPEDALLIQTAHAHQRTDSAVDFYIGVLREQVRAGFFGADTFRTLLDLLPLTDEFKERERKIVGQILEQPRKRLTLAEMRKFYTEGLIDLGDWGDYLDHEGYEAQAQKLLTFDLLANFEVSAEKFAAQRLKEELADFVLTKRAIKARLIPPGSPPP